jgi:hypothetical protein
MKDKKYEKPIKVNLRIYKWKSISSGQRTNKKYEK